LIKDINGKFTNHQYAFKISGGLRFISLGLCKYILINYNSILRRHFYSLAPIFVVSAKCIDPWVLEFMVSNTTGNNQWENCIPLDFSFCGLSEPKNPRKLKPDD
jgi:hypothetical protein